MLITDKIPEYIYLSLEKEGVAREDIMLASYCDMNDDHIFCDTYIIATEKKICLVSGSVRLEGAKSTGGRPESVWIEDTFRELDVDEIEKLKLEEMLSGARLVVKMKSGEHIFLTAMTNTCRSSVLLFIKYFERMKKGDIKGVDFDIDEEDDPKERCCPKCGMRYPDKNRKIYNGMMKTYLYQYMGPKPPRKAE